MKRYKIPQSFKFCDQTMTALRRLARLPIYGTKTRVIESLVYDKAVELGLVKPIVNNSDNGKNAQSPTQ